MATKEGQKTGGRAKGTPNRVTADLRGVLGQVLTTQMTPRKLNSLLKQLDPQQKINALTKLLEYTIPKMRSVEAKVDMNRLSDEQLDMIISELTSNINDNDNTD